NGFLAAIDEALFDDVGEQSQLIRFIFLVEGQVRIVPIAENAEALELFALAVDVLPGVRFAGLADGGGLEARFTGWRAGRSAFAQLLRDFELDRQSVAVPARHIGRTV